MWSNVVFYIHFLSIVAFILFRRYKYKSLRDKLKDKARQGLFPWEEVDEYSSLFARIYILMPFPSRDKYSGIYDTNFTVFKKRIRIIEFITLFLVILGVVLIILIR